MLNTVQIVDTACPAAYSCRDATLRRYHGPQLAATESRYVRRLDSSHPQPRSLQRRDGALPDPGQDRGRPLHRRHRGRRGTGDVPAGRAVALAAARRPGARGADPRSCFASGGGHRRPLGAVPARGRGAAATPDRVRPPPGRAARGSGVVGRRGGGAAAATTDASTGAGGGVPGRAVGPGRLRGKWRCKGIRHTGPRRIWLRRRLRRRRRRLGPRAPPSYVLLFTVRPPRPFTLIIARSSSNPSRQNWLTRTSAAAPATRSPRPGPAATGRPATAPTGWVWTERSTWRPRRSRRSRRRW